MKTYSLIAARELKKGDVVRFGDRGACPIEDIGFDQSKMVTGGEMVTSAMAMRLTLINGKMFFVHPGSEIYAISS